MADAWEKFEEEFAAQLGLTRVPGSGSQWHCKMDVTGQGARWELKYRGNGRYTVTRGVLDKILAEAEGMGSANEIPLMAIRFDEDDDYILMRKNDFLRMQAGEIVLTRTPHEARAQRKKRAATPVLLRDEDDAGS